MNKLSKDTAANRIDNLCSLLDASRSELLALQKEVDDLRRINNSLDHRLDVVRSWALRNIHVRNELAKHVSQAAANSPSAGTVQ